MLWFEPNCAWDMYSPRLNSFKTISPGASFLQYPLEIRKRGTLTFVVGVQQMEEFLASTAHLPLRKLGRVGNRKKLQVLLFCQFPVVVGIKLYP